MFQWPWIHNRILRYQRYRGLAMGPSGKNPTYGIISIHTLFVGTYFIKPPLNPTRYFLLIAQVLWLSWSQLHSTSKCVVYSIEGLSKSLKADWWCCRPASRWLELITRVYFGSWSQSWAPWGWCCWSSCVPTPPEGEQTPTERAWQPTAPTWRISSTFWKSNRKQNDFFHSFVFRSHVMPSVYGF